MNTGPPVTVLMLQAGAARGRLDLAEEHRQVVQAVSRALYRDALNIQVAQAVRPNDVSYLLQHHRPQVVHFSGEGTADSGILLRCDDGGLAPIETTGLRRLVENTCPQLQLVVLNSCWSSDLARQLAAACGCAVGMTSELPDTTAIAFATELYQALAFGQSVGRAVWTARAALELHGVYRPGVVQIVARDGVDPDHEFVVPARWRRPPDRESAKPNATATIARNRKQRFIALVAGADDSADGFVSKLYAANIDELQVQWIPAIDDEGPQ